MSIARGKRKHSFGSQLFGLTVNWTLSISSAFLFAYVFRDIWLMFVSPTWGLAAPAMPTAYGVSCLVALVTHHRSPADVHAAERDVDEKGPIERAIEAGLYRPVLIMLCWGFAYLVRVVWGY